MGWRPSTRDGEHLPHDGRPHEGARRFALRAMPIEAVALVGALMLGCSGPPGKGRTLGTDLGTFLVDATEATNDCGPNALGSSPELAFDVELARADSELFWDGRVAGTIGADLDFELSARIDVELRPARAALPGCSVVRDDQITGDLRPDEAGALTAFTGQMRFDFAATPESSCTLEELGLAQLSRLPCGMRYTLSAQRTRAPTP
jgi:hypothetical protein